jgi:hypothetical protein
MSQETVYLLNGVVAGFIDTALQHQDVTPLIVQMPASWNEPRTRYTVRIIGSFHLPQAGDLFIRKFWIGKTLVTQANTQAIRPGEQRLFMDEHDILWYGDNLHAIYSRHSTSVVSTEEFTGAVPSTSEMSAADALSFVDDNLNSTSFSLFGTTQDPTERIGFSIREYSIEKIDI